MAKPLINIVCCWLLFMGPGILQAQEIPTIKATVDKNQILIGEPIRLSVDIKSPMVSGNQLPSFDSLPHFELIEKGSLDSLISAAGASYHMEWKLTSFDSGTRIIPALSLTIGKQIYKTDSLAIEVSYGSVDTSKDYHDIKSIIDIENPDVKYIPWAMAALTALTLFLFIWFIRKPLVIENTSIIESRPSSSTALEDALASLDRLKDMLHQDPSVVKKYYSGLHDVLRIFLQNRLGLVTMEKTSEELILSLSDLHIDREAFTQLAASLRMGDFVKFAKYIPGPYENDSNLEVVRSSIVKINENEK